MAEIGELLTTCYEVGERTSLLLCPLLRRWRHLHALNVLCNACDFVRLQNDTHPHIQTSVSFEGEIYNEQYITFDISSAHIAYTTNQEGECSLQYCNLARGNSVDKKASRLTKTKSNILRVSRCKYTGKLQRVIV